MIHQTLLLALAGVAFSIPTSTTVVPRQQNDFSGANQDGLQNGGCAQNIIIFARGTTEPGNVGVIAGPPFFQAMADAVGAENLAVQGVDYPADVGGFLAGGDADGSQLMAQLTQQAVTDCPDSKVVMSGYSQGGQLVHNAAEMLPSDVTAKVAGAVIFGDPDNGDAVQGIAAENTKVFCNRADNICDGGALILPAHLTYGQDADEAAQFAAAL